MSGQMRAVDNYVTTKQNTANELSTIFSAEVPDNEKYLVPDQALLNMKLYNSAGEDISANTEIYVGVMLPADDHPRKVDKKSYLPFNTLSLEKQYDDENNSECRLEIDRGAVVLLEQHKFVIQINSPDVVDWTKSTLELNNVKKGRM